MMNCDLHDYIEIACMFNYPVKLIFKSGSMLEGIAIDTQRNKSHEECLKIKVESVETLVPLNDISTMEASVDNPHFQVINFG
ncbi:MAG: Rho-binding antiterminator [Psychrobium sp.]|nr:Rho-binding antiterminator [Psychrobium sp.]